MDPAAVPDSGQAQLSARQGPAATPAARGIGDQTGGLRAAERRGNAGGLRVAAGGDRRRWRRGLVCAKRHFVAGLTDGDVEEPFRSRERRSTVSWPRRPGPARDAARLEATRNRLRGNSRGALAKLRSRLGEIRSVDFFSADGRDAVETCAGRARDWSRQKAGSAPGEEATDGRTDFADRAAPGSPARECSSTA